MDLVIQGFDIETRDLKEIAKLSRATAIRQLAPTAFGLASAHAHDDIAALCERARLDFGFVPEQRRLEDFRLLVMDMDSTLITIETIDELADMPSSVKPAEVKLAQQVMGTFEGELDFTAYRDEYQEGLRGIIDAKIEGREVVAPEVEAPPKVVNLMEALRKSLDAVSSGKKKTTAMREPAERKRARA